MVLLELAFSPSVTAVRAVLLGLSPCCSSQE